MISMTYGILPSREQFDAAWEKKFVFDGETYPMSFGNDKRVGSCLLSREELWEELCAAHAKFHSDNGENEMAGQWCSDVLSILGIEWV
jgi:hypothetical protein